MSEPWFRAKRYGYGAGLPIHWRGWVLTAVYLVLALAAASLMPLLFPDSSTRFVRIAGVMMVTIPFLLAVKAKTAGGWRWRWGQD